MIEVKRIRDADPWEFEVRVREGVSATVHRVSLGRSTYEKLSSGGQVSPERCIEAAFVFLLEREPKESILRTFDVTVISRYFPDFEKRFSDYTGE